MRKALAIVMIWAAPCLAETGPSQAALDDAVKLGAVATLAPLCGLRDEAWSFDLRRATIMDSTRTTGPDDPALRQAPGSQLSIGALSFAEAEALEDFAAGPPGQTCGPLASNPDLTRADHMVKTFRALRGPGKPGS